MFVEINSHIIYCRWFDDFSGRKLSEVEKERIQRLLSAGKIEGEIIQYDEVTNKDYWGWWKISR